MDNLRKILIYDTTLRDGEQSPGFAMTVESKVKFARQLELLGVDIIEAGFPASSAEDFESVKKISGMLQNVEISALARARESDIDSAWKSIETARRPRIHIFLSSSDIHINHQLKKNRDEVLSMAEESVRYAGRYCENIQFSCMDATRTDMDFLFRMIERVIAAGAKIVNISDTVGSLIPSETYDLVRSIIKNVPDIGSRVLSIHCHNDLGLATANSIAAVSAGVSQVECTVNGIGERGGVAALEEIAVTLEVKKEKLNCTTGINLNRITEASRSLSMLTGVPVQPNKAIVGSNAFSHKSGIHQDGMIKKSSSYELFSPGLVGADSVMIYGRHSGRNSIFRLAINSGVCFDESKFDRFYLNFKEEAGDRSFSEEEMKKIIVEKLS